MIFAIEYKFAGIVKPFVMVQNNEGEWLMANLKKIRQTQSQRKRKAVQKTPKYKFVTNGLRKELVEVCTVN